MISTDIGVWIAGLLTLAAWSFVYKDNKVFRFVEYTFVSTTIGYTIVIGIKSLKDIAYTPILAGNYHLIIAVILGLLIFTQLSRQTTWISKYPVAIIVGTALGVGARASISGTIVPQVIANISLPYGSTWDIINTIVIVVTSVTSIFYFFFTRDITKHPVTSTLSRIGRVAIMIALGSGFGYTILGRFTLLLGRLQFIWYDWLGLVV
jgi:lipoprotein signal peptidase